MYLPTTAMVTSWAGWMMRCNSCRQSSISSGLAFRFSFSTISSSRSVLHQAERHFVDAELLVAFLDDRARLDVAEQRDLLGVVLGQLAFGPADEDVGLDTDLPQLADRVLRRLGLRFPGGLEVGNQRQMNVQAIVLADVERELPDGFQEGHAFDIADGAADLGDDHVHVVGRQLADGRLDLVGDVRDDLDGPAEVIAAPFLLDDGKINPARGVIAIAAERGVGEALVMAQVEVGLGPVVEHVDFAVLVGAHGAGIDVDVRIEFLQADRAARGVPAACRRRRW